MKITPFITNKITPFNFKANNTQNSVSSGSTKINNEFNKFQLNSINLKTSKDTFTRCDTEKTTTIQDEFNNNNYSRIFLY